MRRLIPFLIPLLAVACERDRPSPSAPSTATRTALQQAAKDRDVGAEPLPDVLETAAPRPGECGGLVGVQKVKLVPTQDEAPTKFRFGVEEDALVYETEWTGDLNDDGAEDRIARRETDGSKTVRIVMVGCGEEFALAWVGVARSIAVAPETTTVEERDWKRLGIDAGTGVKTFEFNGQKYVDK